jgi:hypothetical protein
VAEHRDDRKATQARRESFVGHMTVKGAADRSLPHGGSADRGPGI